MRLLERGDVQIGIFTSATRATAVRAVQEIHRVVLAEAQDPDAPAVAAFAETHREALEGAVARRVGEAGSGRSQMRNVTRIGRGGSGPDACLACPVS